METPFTSSATVEHGINLGHIAFVIDNDTSHFNPRMCTKWHLTRSNGEPGGDAVPA
jgi:hypothetical protein